MNKIINLIITFMTGLYLIYAIYITTLETFPEVLAWGFMALFSFYGWLKVFALQEVLE